MPKRTTNVAASAARTTNGSGNSHAVVGATVGVAVNVTAIGGTPNMVVSLQWSNDNVTWFDADTADSMTAITGISAKVKTFTAKGLFVRPVWVITGSTPSLTFTCDIFSVA